jgi:cell fate (sporulation/competence/biofilm development) regulator YlbF (YheA/YmcA/DUF963 family)
MEMENEDVNSETYTDCFYKINSLNTDDNSKEINNNFAEVIINYELMANFKIIDNYEKK